MPKLRLQQRSALRESRIVAEGRHGAAQIDREGSDARRRLLSARGARKRQNQRCRNAQRTMHDAAGAIRA